MQSIGLAPGNQVPSASPPLTADDPDCPDLGFAELVGAPGFGDPGQATDAQPPDGARALWQDGAAWVLSLTAWPSADEASAPRPANLAAALSDATGPADESAARSGADVTSDTGPAVVSERSDVSYPLETLPHSEGTLRAASGPELPVAPLDTNEPMNEGSLHKGKDAAGSAGPADLKLPVDDGGTPGSPRHGYPGNQAISAASLQEINSTSWSPVAEVGGVNGHAALKHMAGDADLVGAGSAEFPSLPSQRPSPPSQASQLPVVDWLGAADILPGQVSALGPDNPFPLAVSASDDASGALSADPNVATAPTPVLMPALTRAELLWHLNYRPATGVLGPDDFPEAGNPSARSGGVRPVFVGSMGVLLDRLNERADSPPAHAVQAADSLPFHLAFQPMMATAAASTFIPVASPQYLGIPLPQLAATIVGSMGKTPDGMIEIRLSPEELGEVRVMFRTDTTTPDRVVVMLTFDKPDTLDLFRRHSEQLAEALRQAGFAQADIGFGQHGAGQSHSGADKPRRDVWAQDQELDPALTDRSGQPDKTTPRRKPVNSHISLDLRL